MVERLDFSHPSPTGARIAGGRVRVYRLPCRIHHQDQPEFMDHMARIFLEDLRTPSPPRWSGPRCDAGITHLSSWTR